MGTTEATRQARCRSTVPLPSAHGELRVQAGTPHYGADPVLALSLYDHNPQTFVSNIFFARPEDFHAATMTVERDPQDSSAVLFPIVSSK
jgi:hypothetical protein